ncbi:MAG: Serine/threonine-protein kinase PrkC, partial [Planctomycetota bacterium]
MSDLTDKRLGEFQLLRRLGSGGMAEVFLAEQTSLQRHVAVKVMKPSLMAHSGSDLLAHFRQEAMMAAGLNHPNIVQVYTIGEEQGFHYIAQEYVQGSDLATLLRERGKLDLASALHVMRQVAAALKASGKAGIVHRDIKPENILVNKKGEVKVADFGLAQLGKSSESDSGGQTRGVTMGTPLYMSPEQVRGRELDPRSDIYSFGVTCYQLLSGDTPFRGVTAVQIAMQHLKNPPPPLHEKNPSVPKILCRMVHRMMDKRRSLRYQSAEEVLEDLKTLIAANKQGRSLDLV